MSSSVPRVQLAEPEDGAAPFPYAEAQPGGTAAAGDAGVEELARRREGEAFERGRQAAGRELEAKVEAALAAGRRQVAKTLAEFAGERAAYYRRVEGEVVQLALAVARKVLHREAQLDPHLLAGIVRVTLEKLDAATRADLYVHPAEATDWRHYFARQMEGAAAPEVHEDGALGPGECRIETSLGATEIGIGSQLKEIETGLLDLLAERPGAEQAAGTAVAEAAAGAAKAAAAGGN